MNKFDLTTNQGLDKALKFVGDNLIMFNPLVALGKSLIERIFHSPEEEGKMVASLIEKGKKAGVAEMEITVNKKNGLHFNVPIEDVDIKFMVGGDGEAKIKVKYK